MGNKIEKYKKLEKKNKGYNFNLKTYLNNNLIENYFIFFLIFIFILRRN